MNLLERIERHFAWRADIDAQEIEWHREFGLLMRAQRVASGMSLRSMAILLDMSPSAVSDYENGNRVWSLEVARVYLDVIAVKTHGVPQTP